MYGPYADYYNRNIRNSLGKVTSGSNQYSSTNDFEKSLEKLSEHDQNKNSTTIKPYSGNRSILHKSVLASVKEINKNH